jgi:hypothetical protein
MCESLTLTAHVPTELGPADICTKVVPGGMKRDGLVSLVLYDVSENDLTTVRKGGVFHCDL